MESKMWNDEIWSSNIIEALCFYLFSFSFHCFTFRFQLGNLEGKKGLVPLLCRNFCGKDVKVLLSFSGWGGGQTCYKKHKRTVENHRWFDFIWFQIQAFVPCYAISSVIEAPLSMASNRLCQYIAWKNMENGDSYSLFQLVWNWHSCYFHVGYDLKTWTVKIHIADSNMFGTEM